MIIYLTMTLAVLLVEVMHYSGLPKFRKYISWKEWFQERWDNLFIALVSGVLLCAAFPEVSLYAEGKIEMLSGIHNYPHIGGGVIGLSSTPIINWVKKKTKKTLKDNG